MPVGGLVMGWKWGAIQESGLDGLRKVLVGKRQLDSLMEGGPLLSGHRSSPAPQVCLGAGGQVWSFRTSSLSCLPSQGTCPRGLGQRAHDPQEYPPLSSEKGWA